MASAARESKRPDRVLGADQYDHPWEMDGPALPIVPVSAIEHYEYCPRQCALIHVDGIWAENPHTVRGRREHRRVDDHSQSRIERGKQVLRAVPLWSERYGLSGRADVVEVLEGGTIRPVEHKSGVRHGITADLQVCAQAICLEEMLDTSISGAAIWYGGPRRRFQVELTSELRRMTLQTVAEIREQLVDGVLPGAPNDARCTQCQLRHHCLPEISANSGRVAAYLLQVLPA